MNEFLDELTMHIADASVLKYIPGKESEAERVNGYSIDTALGMVDSLGPNAQLMLEIGILQDELVKLEFEINRSEYPYEYWKNQYFVHFLHETIVVGMKLGEEYPNWESFKYTSPTWQQDVLNKVYELINA